MARIDLSIKGIQALQAQNLKLIAMAEGLAGDVGHVYIDPGAINPRSRKRAAEYGVYEHKRGGEHAFFSRTVGEAGQQILANALRGPKRDAVRRATIGAHRQAVARVHVDTGTLRAAVRVRLLRR